MKTGQTTPLEQQRQTLIDALAKGELDAREKRTLTHAQARERLKKWLK